MTAISTESHPLWQTYASRPGQTPKQTSIEDALSALAWSTPGTPDSMTTEELAAAVGCDVESAWHAIRGMDWLEAHTPPGAPMYWPEIDCLDLSIRAQCLWTGPEDPYTDDADWYRYRIEESHRLGRPDAVEFWERERDS